MQLDDICRELNAAETDADLASQINLGILSINNVDKSRMTPGLLAELASSLSGFKRIPLKFMTDDLIELGMQHLENSSSARIPKEAGDAKTRYVQTAVDSLESRKIFVITLHPELINKEILVAAIRNSMLGDAKVLYTNKSIAPLINDEFAIECMAINSLFAFKHLAAGNLSDQVWRSGIAKEPTLAAELDKHGNQKLLTQLVSEGFWLYSIDTGSKPDDLASSIRSLMAIKGQHFKLELHKAFIRGYPIEDVLALLKTPARRVLIKDLYDTDELKPHMKQFPYIKSYILETAMGL